MNKIEQAMDFHKSGQLEEAESVYQEMLVEEPDNADVMYLYSTLQMSMNQLDSALENINKAIEINDNAPAFYQLKGSLQARLGQPQEALKSLDKALKENPNLYQAQIVAGHLHYSLGDKSKAQVHFKSAIKINNDNPEGHVNLARLMIDEGDVENAINILRDIELKHPEQASVKMMLGQAFIENGAYSYAENYFQKVLAMHPEYELAGLYLGVAKLETGDKQNAEKLIMAFNQTHKNTREGMAAMGLLLFKMNRFPAAAQHLASAIGQGMAPLSWRAAHVESIARLGEFKPAIDFYQDLMKKRPNGVVRFRLAELFEKQGKYKKACKLFKELNPQDLKYVGAQLGLARCYLLREKPEKAEKHCQAVLERNKNHAEATYLLVNSFLEQGKESRAKDVLQYLDLETYNDSYKRVFKLLKGLVSDHNGDYQQAYETFSSIPYPEMPDYRKMDEDEVKRVQAFDTQIDDEINSPVFIVGTRSTGVHEFVNWLFEQDVKVLNDRLVSLGRQDILHSFVEMDKLEAADDDMVRLERKIYQQKAKAMLGEVNEEFKVIDSLFINPYQLGIVKKFFPDAKIILLERNTADIWMSQQVFGPEPVNSTEWNEAKNQIISMGLNLTQINSDDWMDNDKEVHKTLQEVLGMELEKYQPKSKNYWSQNRFEKGHWKNYKQYLGK